MSDNDWLSAIKFNDDGLVPAIAQDHQTGRILMLAWMNRESVVETAKSGTAVYWSRSRAELWQKGVQSGNIQEVLDIQLDCDGDVLILKVAQSGGIACHTGRESCFFRSLRDGEWTETEPVLKDPNEIYGDGGQ